MKKFLFQFCIQIRKELNTIQSLLFKNDPYRIYPFRTLCSTRNFSTTSRLLDKNTSNEGSDKSSKDPNKNDENIMLIKKILFISFLTLVAFYWLAKRSSTNYLVCFYKYIISLLVYCLVLFLIDTSLIILY